jgi:hypothetical protein
MAWYSGGGKMITSKVSIDPMYPELISAAKDTVIASPRPNSPKHANNGEIGKTAPVKINDSHFEFSVSQSARSAFNTIAASVRRADRAMLEIEKKINQMKDRLGKHIKNFPPFLHNGEERVKLMRRFSSFRKQIDKLTFPPDNPGAAKIMADPSITGHTGDWNVAIDDAGNQITIGRQPVHTCSEGLNIPELSETATHEEIGASIASLDSAKELLGQRRSTLAADFKRILNQVKIGV